MTKKRSFKGYTLIEIMVSLLIASAFSVGLYSIFVEGTKGINREEVLTDVRNYVTNSLELIVDNIESSEQVECGGDQIILNNKGQSEVRYSIRNDIIYENDNPIKLPGYHWFSSNQNLYNVNIEMVCEDQPYGLGIDPTKQNIINSMYEIEITVDIESKIDEAYQETYTARNLVFALNKFSLL